MYPAFYEEKKRLNGSERDTWATEAADLMKKNLEIAGVHVE
jgi:hypothetical protein